MVDVVSYTLISITCFCFGLIVSFQIAHIHYCKKAHGSGEAINSNKNHCPGPCRIRSRQISKVIFLAETGFPGQKRLRVVISHTKKKNPG